MKTKKLIFNWSGGKDSALALHKATQNPNWSIKSLITTVNEEFNRVSMHGLRADLLEEQVKQIGLPLHQIILPKSTDMSIYDNIMETDLRKWKSAGVAASVFGDIFLEDLRQYRENQMAKIGIEGIFPLWKRNTKELLFEFLDLGFKTIIICANAELLPKEFAGRVIDKDFITDLPKGVDPCGENGEFHTFVFDGPIFQKPVKFEVGDTILRNYKLQEKDDDNCFTETKRIQNPSFWYTDLSIPNK